VRAEDDGLAVNDLGPRSLKGRESGGLGNERHAFRRPAVERYRAVKRRGLGKRGLQSNADQSPRTCGVVRAAPAVGAALYTRVGVQPAGKAWLAVDLRNKGRCALLVLLQKRQLAARCRDFALNLSARTDESVTIGGFRSAQVLSDFGATRGLLTGRDSSCMRVSATPLYYNQRNGPLKWSVLPGRLPLGRSVP